VGLSFAQITTEPDVPNAAGKVTITYDATKGTAGLKDCNCDVYIHIGAVTESAASTTWSIVPFTWATTDPKAKNDPSDGADKSLYVRTYSKTIFFTNPNGLTILPIGNGF